MTATSPLAGPAAHRAGTLPCPGDRES